MRKTLIALCAFMILSGVTVSSAMAQTWTWDQPERISNGFFEEFVVSNNDLYGCDDSNNCLIVTTNMTESGAVSSDGNFGELVDSVGAPLFVVIDENTVGILGWPSHLGYTALGQQPLVPSAQGKFTHVAADSANGTLYVIFEEDVVSGNGNQWRLVGHGSFKEWTEEVGVRFTPRSLNLGSNGKWVTCKIDGFGYDWTTMDLNDLCIVGINDKLFNEPLCVDTKGPSNKKNSRKLMAKFDRQLLAPEITAEIEAELAANPDFDPTSTKITLAFSDGTEYVYWEDTIKTKVPRRR